MKLPSQRQRRMGEQIKHALIEVIQRGRFVDKEGHDLSNVTISEVRPSPDLKHATVFVMTLGGKDLEQTITSLNNSASYFQSQLGRKLTSKFTPRLKFMEDTSFEHVNRLEEIIHNLPKAAESDNG